MTYFLLSFGAAILFVMLLCAVYHNYMMNEELKRSRLLIVKAKDLVAKAYKSQKDFNEMLDRHYGK